MANIFLSVPVLDRPELRMLYSTYQAILSCREHQIRIYFNESDSLISRVRNVHLSVYYYEFPECEYFMSIDSDIEVVNCFPSNNLFTKLISHNLDFVGGLYAIKKPGVNRCSSISIDGITPEFDTGLKEMRWLSTGCWCIKRSAVKKMIDAYPELCHDGDDNAIGKKIHALYLPMIYKLKEGDFPDVKLPMSKMLSEDWAWCERWKAIGGKIYADSSIVLKHIGKIDYSLYNVQVIQKTKSNMPEPGFDLDSNKNE